MKTRLKSLSFRYLKKVAVAYALCNLALTTTERAYMNIYVLTFLAVVIPFLAGYYLGVSDGKVEGRIEQFQAKR
jgi:hypothetical protein